MSLTDLEKKLFESVEFCLAMLSMIPVPICIMGRDRKIIPLNSGRAGKVERQLVCAHAEGPDHWALRDGGQGCMLCSVISECLATGLKVTQKGVWAARFSDSGDTQDYFVVIHAVPAMISGEKYILTAIEDLTEVEQLRGLLPICMDCGKIKDNKSGHWIRLEEYISERSPAKFSHGLCPDCASYSMKSLE
jgi:hypothetical protein